MEMKAKVFRCNHYFNAVHLLFICCVTNYVMLHFLVLLFMSCFYYIMLIIMLLSRLCLLCNNSVIHVAAKLIDVRVQEINCETTDMFAKIIIKMLGNYSFGICICFQLMN